MKTWQLALLVGIIIVAGIGAMIFMRNRSNDNYSTNSNSQTSGTATDNSNQSNTNKLESMEETIDIKDKFVTLSVAGYGDIKVELYDEDAPKTVENFLRLTKSGYYDGITFHRISKGFVIQGGDPTGTGSGGDSAFGGEFADELNPNTPSAKAGYKKGVLAMANRGPNTNTSQFFIMLEDAPQMPFAYTIFGKVVAGLDVVDKIGQAPIIPQMSQNDGTPVDKITITKATISSN
jgi:cyclophilin family peptidyl-prolyl cis-trans isomerase